MCVPNRSIICILILTAVVGMLNTGALLGVSDWSRTKTVNEEHSNFISVLTVSLSFALLTLLYPITGFIADVYSTRYKMIVVSVLLLWCGGAFVTIAEGFSFRLTIDTSLNTAEDVMTAVAALFFFIGYPCFHANIVQFGFDQLLDAPSHYIGLFIHWCMWAESLGGFLVQIVKASTDPYSHEVDAHENLNSISSKVEEGSIMMAFPVFSIVLISMCALQKTSFLKFIITRVRFNPYKLVLKVAVFAIANDRPISPPSAFVYSDRRIPTRMDFAKERFGGPFANSDVEDVKTFGRILCLLLSIAPVFFLDIPISYNVFTLLALHSGPSSFYSNQSVTLEWVLLGSGALPYLSAVIGLSLYMWVTFNVLQNGVPKILIRMGFVIVLYIIAVLSLLILDLTGHLLLQANNKPNIMCMFAQPNADRGILSSPHMNLHWTMFLLPNLLIGLAPKLLMATTFELISAQAPNPMKGLVVGVLFTIRGLSRVLSSLLIIPFSLSFWKDGNLGKDPPVTSCAFGYFLVTIFIALLGLLWFVFSACRYRYRVRDEEGFSQSQVEEVFDRRLAAYEKFKSQFQSLSRYGATDI